MICGVLAQTPCKPSDPVPSQASQFIMKPVSIPGALQREVSGTLTPINGCEFKMNNFTISPACVSSYFYALSIKDGQLLSRLGGSALGNVFRSELSYNLIQAKWSEMKGMGIYCENEGIMLMQTIWVQDAPPAKPSDAATNLIPSMLWFTVGLGSILLFLTKLY